MSASELKLQISPSLLEAMGLAATGDGVDYFALFGVARGVPPKGRVEAAVLERSKQLRQWQSSPKFGDEVVALLKTLHRASKILLDEKRRAAYTEALERGEKGEQVGAEEEFRELVRAALVDGEISADARKALSQYVEVRKLDPKAAQQITQQIREELKSQRAAAAEQQDANWEFSIKATGAEGFDFYLMGLAQTGRLRDAAPAQLAAKAAEYGVAPEAAAKMIVQCKLREFEAMVRVVAGNSALSVAQGKLLLDKAPVYGLDQQQASQVIAEYSFMATDSALFSGGLTLAETFSQDDIAAIVDNDVSKSIRRSGWSLFDLSMPDWLKSLLIVGVGGGVLIGGGLWIKGAFFDTPGGGFAPKKQPAAPPASAAPAAGPASASATPAAAEKTQAATGAPGAAASPAAPAADEQIFVSKPDPASGFLTLPPEKTGDPKAFDIAIAEVTNVEFQRYLQAMLGQAPTTWHGNTPPAGQEQWPVTGVTREQAERYCHWLNGQPENAHYSVELPTEAEFKRALRGKTLRGAPDDPGYWSRARLNEKKALEPIKQERWDKIFTGHGQIYDLIANAAEWGKDLQSGNAIVLGGDWQQSAASFNHLEPRWMAPSLGFPNVGFRPVRHAK